jgi:hypothetical protein
MKSRSENDRPSEQLGAPSEERKTGDVEIKGMNRKQRLLPTLSLAVVSLAAAVTTALAVGADSAPEPVTQGRVSGDRAPVAATTGELADIAPKPKGGKAVCPGIILKVGPTIELPCRRGAEIVKARSVEVDGRYCAKVTYIAETGSPPRTETLCEGLPSVGG